MKKILKKGYIEDALRECRRDFKKSWRLIKMLWLSENKTTNITKMLDETCLDKMADILNEHFATAGIKVNKSTKPVNIINRSYPSQPNRPQLRDVTPQEIWSLLTGLSPAKATESDGMSAHMIKACRDTIIEPLHYLFNLSIYTHPAAS